MTFYWLLLARNDGCFDLSRPRSRRYGQHFPDDFTMFRPKCVYFWHIFGVFMTKCVYLRPNEDIDVQWGWFSGGSGGVVGPRDWVEEGCLTCRGW